MTGTHVNRAQKRERGDEVAQHWRLMRLMSALRMRDG